MSEEKIFVKFSVIERNVLSEEDFYSQMKKFIVTGRNLQSQDYNNCPREKFHSEDKIYIVRVRHFFLAE